MTKKQRELAETVIAYLRAHPEDHDQGYVERKAEGPDITWEEIKSSAVGGLDTHRLGTCGSVGCIAGWICYVGATRKQLEECSLPVADMAAFLVGLDGHEFASRVYITVDREEALNELESMIAGAA